MKLHPFETGHLQDAGIITRRLWGGEVPDMPEHLKDTIYQYLARYYYVPDSPLSFGVSENGKLLGMILAATAEQRNAPEAPVLSGADAAYFAEYKSYLDGNRAKELQYARPGEAILSLFASTQRGCGRQLLSAFENACRARGIASYLLWTDDTCDREYYPTHGFSAVASAPTLPTLGNMRLTTYFYRRELR